MKKNHHQSNNRTENYFSKEVLAMREASVAAFLAKIIAKSELNLDGFITFVNNSNRIIFIRFFGEAEKKLELKENSIWPESILGETTASGSLKLRVPYFPQFTGLNNSLPLPLVCAEPVYFEEEFIGILGLANYSNQASNPANNSNQEELEKTHLINLAKILTSAITLELEKTTNNGTRKPKALKGFVSKYSFDNIITCSSKINEVITKAKRVAKSNQTVLILGESGTGKELFAHALHHASKRYNGPFVSLNCGAIPANLIESELFGYAEGAFSGASKGGKKGLLELACGGTLFLDEVGDLSLQAQATLLRAVQSNEMLKVGDEKITQIDARFICATNKNLKRMCEIGKFRWDLYYRLAGLVLEIPPLRSRPNDIEILLKNAVDNYNQREKKEIAFAHDAIQLLKQYQWPGNVRELYKMVETACLLTDDSLISYSLCLDLIEVHDFVKEKEQEYQNKKEMFMTVLAESRGKVSAAAKKLNISRATAYRWHKEILEGI